MRTYLIPIETAFFIFPFVAIVFALPYIVFQYKKYGAIPWLRTAIVYSFILYLICVYFLVILPLPSLSTVAASTRPQTQLVPFTFLSDFLKETNLILTDISTYLNVLSERSFLQAVFNALMFLPLGIYLRYYFRCRLLSTILLCFLASLFCEITQLTGLYGLYPRSYRLFDIDDLLLNTMGAIFGYWSVSFLGIFLPSREEIDRRAYQKGKEIPLFRRFCAMMTDWLIYWILFCIIRIFVLSRLGDVRIIVLCEIFTFIGEILFFFVLIPYITKGFTFGKWFFKMKIVSMDGGTPKLHQYLFRYTFLYGMVFSLHPAVSFAYALYQKSAGGLEKAIAYAIPAIIICIVYFIFLTETLIKVFGGKHEYLYERMSRTKNESTIRIHAQHKDSHSA